jgi:glycerol uptake facilitator-like aquaporin
MDVVTPKATTKVVAAQQTGQKFAVALGGAAMDLFAWPTFWLYPVAELVAGAAAGLAFRALNPNDK